LEGDSDMDIMIATAQSRFAKYWKNSNTTWPDLVKRLESTTRTSETMVEFKNMSKKDRDAKKDVGGFVGGALRNGRRKSENVLNRYLVCLDADYAGFDFLETVKANFNYEWLVYSTHSHTTDKPRLRLVIPLDRSVSPDEYQAISRMIAKGIGIDRFDDSTYEPHRLMYYPSTSYDAEYVFERNKGNVVKADAILGMYLNWTDASLWPVSSRVNKARSTIMKKQGDPLEKKGLVGAFCKTYTIQEAITEYLGDVYVGDGERYTYQKGSCAGGVVVYEDKFVFSHHGTDPCGGLLCNAWDLVRIHKFGDLDDEAAQDSPINRLPSYLKMVDLAANDKKVKRLLIEERMDNAKSEFSVETSDIEEMDTSWIEDLETDKKGEVAATIQNFHIILRHDPEIKGMIGLDEFSGKICILRKTPWGSELSSEWTDNDDASLRLYFEKKYKMYSVKKADDALKTILMDNRFHPVRQYLGGLMWDGVQRLDTLFIEYLGADDSEYVRAVTRKAFCAAVGRVMKPGIKFDNMIILSGPQGIGKSYILSKLGGAWFNDSINSLQGKEAYEQLQGSWLIELGELKVFKNSSPEAIKQFISKTHDNFRAPYERRPKTHPRQCVFFGTTNDHSFLSDVTGNRRSWPIETSGEATKDVFKDLTDIEIENIWAEAVYLFEKGETLYLDKRLSELASQIQEEHFEESDLAGMIHEFVERKIPLGWDNYTLSDRRMFWYNSENEDVETIDRQYISPMEVWCELLNGDPKNYDRRKALEIKDVLRRLKGWGESRLLPANKPYGRQRGFYRGLQKLQQKQCL